MNAVIYARYSSSSQTEQSIEGQLRVCKEYADKNGYSIVGEYIDRATTGTNDDRPSFQQMIDDASKKQFDYIICYKLDRFSRNRYDSVFYKHKLEQYGIKVLSAMEAISDTQEGKLIDGILEMIAEMYSHDLSQKVKRGLRESVIKGTFTGGYLLYGYKVVDKRIEIDEQKAEVVRYIFSEYAQGKSKKEIVAELNSRGNTTSRGKKFTINSLQQNLSNSKYIGINMYNGILSPDSYPKIIDNETFEKVQRMLDKHKHAPATAKAKVDYILSGKAFCGHCGANLVGISGTSHTSEKHHYYACSNRYKLHSCNKKHERKETLEKYVLTETLKRVLSNKGMNEISDGVIAEYKKSINARTIAEYEKRLEKIEKDLDAITALMISAESQEVIKRLDTKAKDLSIQKQDLNSEIAKLKLAMQLKHTKAEIVEILQLFTSGDINDINYQKRIVNVFINSVYVFDDKIIVYYNLKGSSPVTYTEMQESIAQIENAPDIEGKKVRILSDILRQSHPQTNTRY